VKPVVHHVAPRVVGGKRRVAFWKQLRRDLEHRFNLTIQGTSEWDAESIAMSLKRIRNKMGIPVVVAQRGTMVFVSHF